MLLKKHTNHSHAPEQKHLHALSSSVTTCLRIVALVSGPLHLQSMTTRSGCIARIAAIPRQANLAANTMQHKVVNITTCNLHLQSCC